MGARWAVAVVVLVLLSGCVGPGKRASGEGRDSDRANAGDMGPWRNRDLALGNATNGSVPKNAGEGWHTGGPRLAEERWRTDLSGFNVWAPGTSAGIGAVESTNCTYVQRPTVVLNGTLEATWDAVDASTTELRVTIRAFSFFNQSAGREGGFYSHRLVQALKGPSPLRMTFGNLSLRDGQSGVVFNVEIYENQTAYVKKQAVELTARFAYDSEFEVGTFRDECA